ncbi:hypothetical protein pb186bvf_002084 [Paramecium bursaria]
MSCYIYDDFQVSEYSEYSQELFLCQQEDKEDSMLMEEEQFNNVQEESQSHYQFQESNVFGIYSTIEPAQQEQGPHFNDSKEATVELVEQVEIVEIVEEKQQEPKKKIKTDRGQVETKNIAAFYARSTIKAIKKRKDKVISNSCAKAIKKIENKQGNIPLVALREFLSNDEISRFSQSYFTSFEFVHDILSSSKQKDIEAPLKYLKNTAYKHGNDYYHKQIEFKNVKHQYSEPQLQFIINIQIFYFYINKFIQLDYYNFYDNMILKNIAYIQGL